MDIMLKYQPHHDSNTELKMLEKTRERSPYVGANLQTSRTPSAIDSHCRSSYETAKRKLHSSRAKVRFYVAGENHNSAIYAVSPQRFSSFDTLLGSLMKTPVCIKDQDKERYIFSLYGSHKITSLDELTAGESYVCATHDVFEQLYKDRDRPLTMLQKYRNALAAARPTHTSQSNRSRHSTLLDDEQAREVTEEEAFISEIKPKLITVLRGGMKPRKSVRILLNKKNTRSFEQVISGISDILCPGEHIKRLFALSGTLVMCLADFYLNDSVFFAYCNDRMNPDDLTLDQSEVKLVGAYRFRTASAYGRVTLTSHQRGVTNNKPRSIPASALPEVYRLSSEPRVASRARSCQPSVPNTPHQREKYSTEPMEKEPRYQTSPHQEQRADKPASPAGSIKTQSPRSEKSSQSINLSPSRSSERRRQLSPPEYSKKSEEATQPTAGAERQSSVVSSRQSPVKQRHLSRKESQASNRIDGESKETRKGSEGKPTKSSHSSAVSEGDDDAFIQDDTEAKSKNSSAGPEPEELNFTSNNNQSLPPSPTRRLSTKQTSPPASPSKRSSMVTPAAEKQSESNAGSPRRRSSVVPAPSPSKRGSITTPVDSKKQPDSVNGSPRRKSSVVPPASPSKRSTLTTPVNQKTESNSESPRRSLASPQKSVKEDKMDDRIATTPPAPSTLLETSRSDADTKSKSSRSSHSRSRSRSKSPSEKSRSRSPSVKSGKRSSSRKSSSSSSQSHGSSQGQTEARAPSLQASKEPSVDSSRPQSEASKAPSDTTTQPQKETEAESKAAEVNESADKVSLNKSKSGSDVNDDAYSADFEDTNDIPPKEDDSYELPVNEQT